MGFKGFGDIKLKIKCSGKIGNIYYADGSCSSCIDENKTKNNRIIRICLNAGGHPIDDLVITQHN